MSAAPDYRYVHMVERQNSVGNWIGQSIHLTLEAAIAACAPGDRVTPYVANDPERRVREVSARLARARS